MQTRVLNVCLHDVVSDVSDAKTIYDTTWRQAEEVATLLQKLQSEQVIDSYHVFFDDGYESALNVVQDINFDVDNENIHLAIITDDIGKPGKLTKKDIVLLADQGFTIDSHGASHVALAIFKEEVLQSSPIGGDYDNTPRGKGNVLSDQGIQYQLFESGEVITSITGRQPVSFVLPYGLYNKEVVYQAAKSNYQRVYTCDAAFDCGQFLAPRLLITQENINHLSTLIESLPMQPKFLI